MAYSQAKRKRSNLTPQELICVFYLLLLKEPGHSIIFKAIELADLRIKGSLKVKCEYFESVKAYRITARDDPYEGRVLNVPASGTLVLDYLKRLEREQELSTQEFVTCFYMAMLRRPSRQFVFPLKDLVDLKKRGKMRMDVRYYPPEKTFIITAMKDSKYGRIITAGNAVLSAMSGGKF